MTEEDAEAALAELAGEDMRTQAQIKEADGAALSKAQALGEQRWKPLGERQRVTVKDIKTVVGN